MLQEIRAYVQELLSHCVFRKTLNSWIGICEIWNLNVGTFYKKNIVHSTLPII